MAVGMGGWKRVKIVDCETTLYSMCMGMIGFMIPLPYSPYRSKYLFRSGTPSDVTHEFYKKLYTNIIRDIDVSS